MIPDKLRDISIERGSFLLSLSTKRLPFHLYRQLGDPTGLSVRHLVGQTAPESGKRQCLIASGGSLPALSRYEREATPAIGWLSDFLIRDDVSVDLHPRGVRYVALASAPHYSRISKKPARRNKPNIESLLNSSPSDATTSIVSRC